MKFNAKTKKGALHKFLRFPTVFVLVEYHDFLLRIWQGLKYKLFRQNWPKMGRFLSITLQKNFGNWGK